MPHFEDDENIYADFKAKCRENGMLVQFVFARLMKAYIRNPEIIKE